MRPFGWRSLVASSLLLAALASAATRPQYGGAVRISTRIAPASLDPADSARQDSITRRNLTRLIFDTLVTLDNAGKVQPALATSWKSESNTQRWEFWLRRDVKFHDGSPLTGDSVAASLRTTNPKWSIFPNGDSVVIECDAPVPNLLGELVLPRNAIAKRTAAGKILGTGPFQIADWQPGKKLTLQAEEGYWNGRPFIDSIAIEMGKSFRDQMISLELGKADLIEVAPEQTRRTMMEGRHVVTSAPLDLIDLLFARERQYAEDGKLREAVSLSLDRASIRNVLLQGQGEPAAGILPNWISGYAFVFPVDANLRRAQELRGEVPRAPVWMLSYDAGDPLGRVIAERIALNARDAGITLQPSLSGTADVRLVHVLLGSIDPHIALANVGASLGLSQPKFNGSSAEDLYQAESAILRTQRLIPLFQLPAAYALSPSVKAWNQDRDGTWRLQDVWLETEKP